MEWISVSDDKKPDNWKISVLLYTPEFENITCGCYSNGAFQKYDASLSGEVTHWHPLPEPPKI